MSNVAIVLQARMGSTRLPGKVLAPVGGRSVLAHCIERLQHHSGLPVIVATTDLFEDDRVAAEAARMGAAIVRGSERDVLRRYVQAAREFSLTEIIRATADNPAVDMDAPRRTLELLHQTGADHVVEFGLPQWRGGRSGDSGGAREGRNDRYRSQGPGARHHLHSPRSTVFRLAGSGARRRSPAAASPHGRHGRRSRVHAPGFRTSRRGPRHAVFSGRHHRRSHGRDDAGSSPEPDFHRVGHRMTGSRRNSCSGCGVHRQAV